MTKNGNTALAPMALVVEQDDDKLWIIDLNGIKRKELKQFQADFQKALEDEDEALFYPWMAKCIKAWPVPDLKPSDAASYPELGLLHHKEAVERFAKCFLELAGTPEAANGSGEVSA